MVEQGLSERVHNEVMEAQEKIKDSGFVELKPVSDSKLVDVWWDPSRKPTRAGGDDLKMHWCANNGVLSFVDDEGREFFGPDSTEMQHVLEVAGYDYLGFAVPFSNREKVMDVQEKIQPGLHEQVANMNRQILEIGDEITRQRKEALENTGPDKPE